LRRRESAPANKAAKRIHVRSHSQHESAPAGFDGFRNPCRKKFRSSAFWSGFYFSFSGACGLIYEVLWCRQLGLLFGNTAHSLSAVLTAFMSGLALGSTSRGGSVTAFNGRCSFTACFER